MKFDLTSFYEDSKRLAYQPSLSVCKKRTGIKRLIAFDDRFEEVPKQLSYLVNQNASPKVRVLDIGIGDGVYEASLDENVRRKCDFFGIDISIKQLKRAKKLLKDWKIVDLNSQRIPYQDNSFDIVISSEVLEHVFYPEKVLVEAYRVLKNKGTMILTFPNSSCLQLRLGIFFFGSSPLLNYPANLEHIRFFTSKDILSLMNNKVILVKKMGLGSLLFDKWNFFFKLPTPRLLQVLSNKLFPDLALGNLLILQKND